MDDAWEVLSAALPLGWREAAKETGAAKWLRKDRREERLLRILLLHVGLGCSLKETALRASLARLANMSDAGLHKRVKKSAGWLRELCVRLFKEQRLAVLPEGAEVRAVDAIEVVRKVGVSTLASQLRAVDAVTVRKRARSRSQWRVHCSVSLPSLACDFFERTKTVAEYKPLFAPVKRRDHLRCVPDTAHVVQMRARRARALARRRDNPPRSIRSGSQPFEERLWIPDSCGQTKPLNLAACQPLHSLQDCEQMPAPIVAGKGVQLVHDDCLQIPEERAGLRAA